MNNSNSMQVINCNPFSVTFPPNYNYPDISKNFLEKYISTNSLGISFIESYYNSDTLCSIRIHILTTTQLHEVIGYTNFRNKLCELGISSIRYYDIKYTAQPIGKSKILINFSGCVEINGKYHYITSSIIIKMILGAPRIVNQIINIHY
jgi:hypothetical protein